MEMNLSEFHISTSFDSINTAISFIYWHHGEVFFTKEKRLQRELGYENYTERIQKYKKYPP